MAGADAELIVNGHSFGSWSGFRSNIEMESLAFELTYLIQNFGSPPIPFTVRTRMEDLKIFGPARKVVPGSSGSQVHREFTGTAFGYFTCVQNLHKSL
jgi:hypothetical protein